MMPAVGTRKKNWSSSAEWIQQRPVGFSLTDGRRRFGYQPMHDWAETWRTCCQECFVTVGERGEAGPSGVVDGLHPMASNSRSRHQARCARTTVSRHWLQGITSRVPQSCHKGYRVLATRSHRQCGADFGCGVGGRNSDAAIRSMPVAKED